MNEQASSSSTGDQPLDFVQKYSYRGYEGLLVPRWKRLLSYSWFELKNTWNRSTLGKILLILILALNFLSIVFATAAASFILQNATSAQKNEIIRNAVNSMVASYLTIGNVFAPSNNQFTMININLGILLIGLFAIAGSGFFADDKQGRVIEMYLTKLQRWEYAITKIVSLAVYIFLFTAGPLLGLGFIYLQAFGANHLQYLDFYTGVFIYSLIVTLLLTMSILVFSSFTDKRAYASLSFFLLYLVGSIFGMVIGLTSNNEVLWLISPAQFLSLLAYVILGDQEIYATSGSRILLNDGIGLESVHVIGLAVGIIIVATVVLAYQIYRLTNREL